MSRPWSERQRAALRAFRGAAAERARREAEVAARFQAQTAAAEQELQARRRAVEDALAAAQADVMGLAEGADAQLRQRDEGQRRAVLAESARRRRAAGAAYNAQKESLFADFQEARWTTTTLHEADRKAARDRWHDLRRAGADIVARLRDRRDAAARLWQAWPFVGDVDDRPPAPLPTEPADPWLLLQDTAARADADLAALEGLRAPPYLIGLRPWLMVAGVWLVLAAPAVLVDAWYYWLLAVTLLVVPAGAVLIAYFRRSVAAAVADRWHALDAAVRHGTQLYARCVVQARQESREQRRRSRERERELLQQLSQQSKEKLREAKERRAAEVRAAQEQSKKRLAKLESRRRRTQRTTERAVARRQAEAQERYDRDLEAVRQAFQDAREETNRRHAEEWTDLLGRWKAACDAFLRENDAIAAACDRWFPAWDGIAALPEGLPVGLPLGRLRVTLDEIPDARPADPQLPAPDLAHLRVPALLPFPDQAALLLKARDEGKPAAARALQALLLRCWTGLPPGKVRCTVIDPVGRGETFGAFMHLADHDEAFIHGRIWTEPAQVEQRLADLTAHMENVLQKYLRNQYRTLAEYNAQAGEVAEPFRFLVVADFPANFSPDAARRLLSLASAGARCGIYPFILLDTKQPLPQTFDLAELERACTCLEWRDGRFAWQDEDFALYPLALDGPPDPGRSTELLSRAGEAARRAGRVEVPFDTLVPPREAWWRADSADGVSVPLGRAGARALQHLDLGRGTAQHVLIAGKTGSGKSTLLHVLVTQLALRYSPREVELYLIDFKKGVEFKSYATAALPHARVVAVESEREFGLSVLQRLDAELSRRGERFRALGVTDLGDYRAAAGPGGEPLPRVLLVVDEFQEFFVEDDRLAQEAALLLDRLVRQGRAFGVHVLLGSQTLGGAYSLARSTIDQMAVRIALQCSEADAHLILSRDNTEAKLLSRPGEAIYNAAHGLLEGNHLFQVVWLADSRRDELLREVRALGNGAYAGPLVFEGGTPADLRTALARPRPQLGPAGPWAALLGDAIAIKDPTAAEFRRQSGANLLILGQHEETAFGLTTAGLISLAAALAPTPAEPALNLAVAVPPPPESDATLTAITDTLPVRLVALRELPALLDGLAAEIERRAQGAENAPPRFLFLYGLQRIRDLRRPDDDFGFSRRGEEQTPYRQFLHVLKEGPPLGVFTIVWCDTLANLQRCLDRQGLREFDLRVLMQMSAADSSALMDSPVAAKLGPQRALYYTEEQGRVEKFRPFAVPAADWVRSLGTPAEAVKRPETV